MTRIARRAAPLCLALGALACTGEDVAGQGNLQLSLSGGLAMREGFPHDEPGVDRLEFAEGWELEFDKYIITVGEIRVREQHADQTDGPVIASWAGPAVVDLMRPPSGVELTTLTDLPATRHDIGLDVVDATAGTENVSASQADFQTMVDNGWTFWMAGTATLRGGSGTSTAVRFSVGFSAPTRFRRCSNGVDGTRGIAIPNASTVGASVYPHSVHLFWDVLLQGETRLRFDPWAAVAGPDGVVTAEGLAQQDLLDLRDASGARLMDPVTKSPVRYDDGGLLPPDQLTLLGYVVYGFRQSIHFNGLGFCSWEPL